MAARRGWRGRVSQGSCVVGSGLLGRIVPSARGVYLHLSASAGCGGQPSGTEHADLTYVPTWNGFVYLAIVLDVFSRKVVGWSMAKNPPSALRSVPSAGGRVREFVEQPQAGTDPRKIAGAGCDGGNARQESARDDSVGTRRAEGVNAARGGRAGVPGGQERHGQNGSVLHRIPHLFSAIHADYAECLRVHLQRPGRPLASADAGLEEEVDQFVAVDESEGGGVPREGSIPRALCGPGGCDDGPVDGASGKASR